MAEFVVIPAHYNSAQTVEATKIGGIGKEVITLLNDSGDIVAVLAIENIAAVYKLRG